MKRSKKLSDEFNSVTLPVQECGRQTAHKQVEDYTEPQREEWELLVD